MNKLNGKLTITRRNTPEGNQNIFITLRDVDAISEVVTIKIPPDKLMNALTGFAQQECTFKMSRPERVGKIRDRKIIIFNHENYNPTPEEISIFKQLVEDSGWEIPSYQEIHSYQDLDNQGSATHRRDIHYHSILVSRWRDRHVTDNFKNLEDSE